MKTSFASIRNFKHAGFGAVAALAVALPASPALAGALDDIKARGEFTYGLEAQYRPFEFRDENNEIVGYDIDVANEIASRLGVKATPVDTNWAAVIQSLYTGQFDLILGGMTATPERYKRVNFSYPYMEASSGLLVRADSGIADASGLGGKVVGAGAGTPSIKMLQMSAEEHGHEFGDDIKTYDDDAVAYEAMRAGRVEAYASSIVSLMEFAKTTDGEFAVVPFTSKHWGQEFTCMAFRKEDEDLRGAFNDLIAEMKADGTLEALQVKWFGQSFVELLPNVPPEW